MGAAPALGTADAAASDVAVTVHTVPASPPPEVMDAIAVAAEAPDRLAASGRELYFQVDPPTGKVSVELRDLDGTVLSTLPPSTALDIADGGSVE